MPYILGLTGKSIRPAEDNGKHSCDNCERKFNIPKISSDGKWYTCPYCAYKIAKLER